MIKGPLTGCRCAEIRPFAKLNFHRYTRLWVVVLFAGFFVGNWVSRKVACFVCLLFCLALQSVGGGLANAGNDPSLSELNPVPEAIFLNSQAMLRVPPEFIQYLRPRIEMEGDILGQLAFAKEAFEEGTPETAIYFTSDPRGFLEMETRWALDLEKGKPRHLDLSEGLHRVDVEASSEGSGRGRVLEFSYHSDGEEITDTITCYRGRECQHRFSWSGFMFVLELQREFRQDWMKNRQSVENGMKNFIVARSEASVENYSDQLRRFRTSSNSGVSEFQFSDALFETMFGRSNSAWIYEWRDGYFRMDLPVFMDSLEGDDQGRTDIDYLLIQIDAKAEVSPDPIMYLDGDILVTRGPSLLAFMGKIGFETIPSDIGGLTRIVIPNSEPFESVVFHSDTLFFTQSDTTTIFDRHALSPRSLIDCSLYQGEISSCSHTFKHEGLVITYQIPEADLGNWSKWRQRAIEIVDELQVSS